MMVLMMVAHPHRPTAYMVAIPLPREMLVAAMLLLLLAAMR